MDYIESLVYRILLTISFSHIDTISEGVSLGNLLRQVMSCAFSVGSVGVDFRSLLPSIFEEKILDVFSNQIAKSLADANYMLDGSKWALSNDSLENLGINYHDSKTNFPKHG